MIIILCFVYALSVVITVASNPLGQLVQSCNVCQPSYSPTSIPVAIQQPSNTNPYPQPATIQTSAALPGPLGDSLNQIILNRILSNPSLQKIVDPNTKLYNQNGDEVQRQVRNTGVPNVINNYFIVPPEFFNLNETNVINEDEDVKVSQNDKKRHRKRKLKRKIKKIEPSSSEDEDVVRVVDTKRKQKNSDAAKLKRKRINDSDDSTSLVNELDELEETIGMKNHETEQNKRKPRLKQIKKPATISIEESDEVDAQEIKDPVVENVNEKPIRRSKKPKPKNNKVVDEESHEILHEVPQPKSDKIGFEKNFDNSSELSQTKKKHRKESTKSDDKILKNIEIPTEISNRVTEENRKTRDSKRREPKKEPEQKMLNTPIREPPPNITPFSDDVLKNFFPYMGNIYNSNTNYPYNFDQYYQYPDAIRNNDSKIKKRKRKNQNRKNNEPNSNTHTIEIKLKPRKKDNTTETPVTTEPPKDVVSIEVDQSLESFEQVTDIPMEMPHKVFPITKENTDSSSKESYETFSKLEDLHEFITPDLGTEDEVLPMIDNGIINDYYPIFDDDVYYNPYAEKVKTLDDDRYFYETEIEDKTNRDIKKFERYEDSRVPKRETRGKEFSNSNDGTTKTGLNKKFNSDEYLDHDIVKSSDDIRRVKVPPKNTRVIPENVETVYAGSKIAKFGVLSDETIEDTSSNAHNVDEGYTSGGHTTYVVAKSLGRPEDY